MQSEIKNLIRSGIVSEVFPERHAARVVFEDKDDVVSAELSILNCFASKNKCYHLPDVGESVVCIFEENDSNSGTGFIVGSFFNDEDKPNANSQDVSRLDFGDGTFIEYNRAEHKFMIDCIGDIYIKGKNIHLN